MSSRTGEPNGEETISVFESDGKIVARDESTGVSSFGNNKSEALQRLGEALELYEEPVHDEDEPDSKASAPWL